MAARAWQARKAGAYSETARAERHGAKERRREERDRDAFVLHEDRVALRRLRRTGFKKGDGS